MMTQGGGSARLRRGRRMRTFVAALAVMLLTLPAYAQGKKHHNSDQKSTEQKPKTDDKAYGRALSSLPDRKYDPWKDMR
jgi:hypothetical protein